MDKVIKRKTRKLWRDRLLMGFGTATALGFSALQLHAVLQHRPQQPSWSLELAQSLEVLTDENSSPGALEQAQAEVQAIAQQQQLPLTGVLLGVPAPAPALLDLAQDLARHLAQELERARAQVSIQNLEGLSLKDLDDLDQKLQYSQILFEDLSRAQASASALMDDSLPDRAMFETLYQIRFFHTRNDYSLRRATNGRAIQFWRKRFSPE